MRSCDSRRHVKETLRIHQQLIHIHLLSRFHMKQLCIVNTRFPALLLTCYKHVEISIKRTLCAVFLKDLKSFRKQAHLEEVVTIF